MKKQFRRAIAPIVVSGLGLVAIMASWSCLPPLQVGRSQIVVKATATPGPIVTASPSGSPSGVSSPAAGASAAPSGAPAAAPDLTPAPGRKYTLTQTGNASATLQVEVLTYTGSAGTYNLTTTPNGASPMVQSGLSATRANGVFWMGAGPSPVTKDIASYPVETVTVKAGTFQASKVTATDGTNLWFAQGIEIKSVNAAGTTELVSVQ